jgi:hypothetical protein
MFSYEIKNEGIYGAINQSLNRAMDDMSDAQTNARGS